MYKMKRKELIEQIRGVSGSVIPKHAFIKELKKFNISHIIPNADGGVEIKLTYPLQSRYAISPLLLGESMGASLARALMKSSYEVRHWDDDYKPLGLTVKDMENADIVFNAHDKQDKLTVEMYVDLIPAYVEKFRE